jgi:hypothetical protein
MVVYHSVFMLALAQAAAADPKSAQCWECLRRLALELPETNPQQDPSYEQGLSPGSVLPALAACSLDDSEITTLQQIIKIFGDARFGPDGPGYVRDQLAQLPQLSSADRGTRDRTERRRSAARSASTSTATCRATWAARTKRPIASGVPAEQKADHQRYLARMAAQDAARSKRRITGDPLAGAPDADALPSSARALADSGGLCVSPAVPAIVDSPSGFPA